MNSARLFLVVVITTLAPLAFADSFSTVSINSSTSVNDPEPDTLTSSNGAAVELSAASTTSRAFSNGSGGFTIKPITDDVFARSSLAAGELKARAVLGLGANTFVSGAPMPVGQTNGSASATATFADSFSTFAGASPFLWSSGDTASFAFSITGDYSVPNNVLSPTSPGQPNNLVLGTLRFQAYASGGLDLLQQLNTFDFANRPFSEFTALNNQLQAKRLPGGLGFWYLGDPIASFPAGSDPVLLLDPVTPTNVSFTFNPAGDFEWTLTLDATIQLDASLQNTTATLDFSHTIQTTYTGPAGTITLSSSGLFPGTVPEPGTLTLLLPALALAATRRRR